MSDINGGSSEYPSTRSLTSQISEEEAILVSLDLVSAARRNLKFLRYVADSDWLHHLPTLLEAIRRYEDLWMPLIADLTVGQNHRPPMILPPFDIEWIWYCHTLKPAHYREYCKARFSKVIGRATIFDEVNEEYAVKLCRDIWIKRYPNEPFENEVDSEVSMGGGKKSDNEVILLGEMRKQRDSYDRFFREPYMGEIVYLIAAKRRYKKFLQLVIMQQNDGDGDGCSCVLVPTVDILLMWFTHQSYPTVYAADTKHMEDELLLKVVGPWDHSVQEEDIEQMKVLWEDTFDQPYEKAGGKLAVEFRGGFAVQTPFYWVLSDSDVNIKYKSLHPRFLLEVCVFARLRSHMDATQAEKTREFLRLRMFKCHKELKFDKLVSSFAPDSWQMAWNFYSEFGTKGLRLELRHPGNLCFSGTGVLDTVSFSWNDLLRAPSLAFGSEVDQKIRVFTSITPPVQAPYLLKCVPDRVSDDSGAMISDVMLKMNQYRPQEGRWLSRTVLDHAGRECFVVRIRVGGGFWRRGGEAPETVRWEDRIIEIREGPWSYVAGSTIGTAPDKVVGSAKPKEEPNERTTWCFSTGDELTIEWESTSSLETLRLTLNTKQNSSVKLLKGRKMQYEVSKEEGKPDESEDEFVTIVRFSDETPNGKATALLNWKLLAVELLPEEDAVFVLLLCVAILRSVSEMRKEDVGGLLIRRRLKEAKHGDRDWGSIILHPSCITSYPPSPHLQPWYWNAKAVISHDPSAEHTLNQPSFSMAEGGDKLYKRGIIS
ncbi:glycine-rich domain-containing protein 1 isoform X1 [Amaranthus tricolor]|uniref:glycine-rich domain-containing protein 1 isoform X1 n=1 Tax=Amaranthus tricolor TaxID=29722 RepID=UPI0025842511|nr:glycine-rich domain-containing protein 1 isoform X1 [Amaranthus tricolor]